MTPDPAARCDTCRREAPLFWPTCDASGRLLHLECGRCWLGRDLASWSALARLLDAGRAGP